MTTRHDENGIYHPLRWRVLAKWGGVLVLIGLSMGCAFVRGEMGSPFPEDQIKHLEKGKTTRQEVALRFGAPDEDTRLLSSAPVLSDVEAWNKSQHLGDITGLVPFNIPKAPMFILTIGVRDILPQIV